MNPVELHIKNLISSDGRLDGRKHDELREIAIERGLVKTAEGSARVKFGDSEVLAGVKLSIGSPFPDTPDKGALMVNVELLPLSSPEFESGPPSIDSIEISRVVDRSIRESGALDMKTLCVEEGEKVWIVSIDIVPINAGGNLFDVSCLAALAALQDAKYPVLADGVVDYKQKTKTSLDLKDTPLLVTVCKVGDKLLVDLNQDEEKVVDARIGVTVLENGNICSLQKGGDEGFSSEELNTAFDLAISKSAEMRTRLNSND
jgi:exosome complex component RRP42